MTAMAKPPDDRPSLARRFRSKRPARPGARADRGSRRRRAAYPRQRLAAYDEGYKAGWDDAGASDRDEQGRISAEFARTLQDLSFTYHEARFQAEAALIPLLEALVEVALPTLLREGFVAALQDLVRTLLPECGAGTATLRCAPADLGFLEQQVALHAQFPLEVGAEPSLLPGQAALLLGHETHRIDTEALRARIAALIATPLSPQTEHPPEKVRAHAR